MDITHLFTRGSSRRTSATNFGNFGAPIPQQLSSQVLRFTQTLRKSQCTQSFSGGSPTQISSSCDNLERHWRFVLPTVTSKLSDLVIAVNPPSPREIKRTSRVVHTLDEGLQGIIGIPVSGAARVSRSDSCNKKRIQRGSSIILKRDSESFQGTALSTEDSQKSRWSHHLQVLSTMFN